MQGYQGYITIDSLENAPPLQIGETAKIDIQVVIMTVPLHCTALQFPHPAHCIPLLRPGLQRMGQ